jgi:hypothetical protein
MTRKSLNDLVASPQRGEMFIGLRFFLIPEAP